MMVDAFNPAKGFNRIRWVNACVGLLAAVCMHVATPVRAQSASAVAPDQFIRNVTDEILEEIKQNKDALLNDPRKLNQLVDNKVLPHVNFQKMTAQIVGRAWREAGLEQKKRLQEEFRALLIRTYSGALSQVKDQKIEVKPLRAGAGAGANEGSNVVVQSVILRPRAEPVQLDYRVEKSNTGNWRIYDVNVAGLWLVETYRTQFAAEVNRSGIDGLIKLLTEKNRNGQVTDAPGASGSPTPSAK
jgi:phospholipid transport system substrate-binding protein